MTKASRYRLEARAAAAVAALASVLPLRVVRAFGRGLGRLLGDLDRRHVAVATANLRQAFPHWDEVRRLRTAREVYAHFGQVLLEILWLHGRSREQVLPLVELEGRDNVEAAFAAGRGVLCVTAHIGNWEMHGLTHGWMFGPISVVARPLDNPDLHRRLCEVRTLGGNAVIDKRHALAQVVRGLKGNRGIAILIDQNVQAQDGIFVDFFGRAAATTTVAAALATGGTGSSTTRRCAGPPPEIARPTSPGSPSSSRRRSRAGSGTRRSSGSGSTSAGRRSRAWSRQQSALTTWLISRACRTDLAFGHVPGRLLLRR